MSEEILVRLVPKKRDADFSKLIIKIANDEDINLRDYDVYPITSVIDEYKEDFMTYLIRHGLTSYIRRHRIIEAVVAKGASRNRIIDVFKRYLDSIGVDKELIIVDPYFYATSKNRDYAGLVKDVLHAHLETLQDIIVITSHRVDNTIKNGIERQLKSVNPSLNIQSRVSSDWHDRYWITNSRTKGILTGTSLNGLGIRYSVVDILDEIDVSEIVEQLVTAGLL